MRCSQYKCRLDTTSSRCCFICGRAGECGDPCLNHPAKCGYFRMAGMKAISLWQPYASLLVDGPKIYETRDWRTDYRGPMAIHAAKRPPSGVLQGLSPEARNAVLAHCPDVNALPLGCILGIGTLTACHLITDKFIAGLSGTEYLLGDFRPGRFAWEFKDMTPLREPVPASGHQRMWNWEGIRYDK